jgi:hypothetical protein
VSVFGDATAAIRNVMLMQGHLERMDRQIEQLDRTQDGFREAMFRLSERLVRVETMLEMAEKLKPARQVRPKAIIQEKK